MAVDFGNTLMEGGIEPTVKVQDPVMDNSGAVLAEALAPVAKTVGGVIGGIFKGQQESAEGKIYSRFRNELSEMADAVDQRGLTPQAAQIRARAMLRQYEASYPALSAGFAEEWASFTGESGLGHVLRTGTNEQQAIEAVEKAAITNGFHSVQDYQRSMSLANVAADSAKRLQLIQDQNGTITESQKTGHLVNLNNWASSSYPAAQSMFNQAVEAMTTNPANAPQIAQQLDLQLGSLINDIKVAGGPVDSTYLTSPITSLRDDFKKLATGEITNEVFEGRIKSIGNVYKMAAMSDPIIAAKISQSALMKEAGFPLENLWTPEELRQFADAVSGTSPNIFARDPNGKQVDSSNKLSEVLGSNLTDEASIEEAKNVLNSYINAPYTHERSIKDGAMDLKAWVNDMGSPEVAAFIAKNGAPAVTNAAGVVDVLQRYYESELNPVVLREWSTPRVVPIANSANPNETDIRQAIPADVIEPRWNGNGIEFVPKAEFANDPRIISMAQDMTSGSNSVAIPLNRLINAHANITGEEAKSVYEQQFAGRLFNVGAEDGEKAPVADRVTKMLDQNDVENGDNQFTMGDFAPETLEPREEYVSQGSGVSATLPPIDPGYVGAEGIDFNSYLPSIRSSESGGNDSAKNPLSTATGRYQFLKSTWNGLVDKYPSAGITKEGRLDPQQQEIAIRLFTAENARYLKSSGVSLNNGTLYAAHFLGASDAAKVLKASDSDMVSAHVPSRVINANPFLNGMTVAKFKSWSNRKGNA